MGRILIVEDDQIICTGLNSIIKTVDSTQEVFMTGYAEKALDYAIDKKIDAFFLDIQLEDYSGLKLAEQLREIDYYKFTPIVFITAVPTRELEAFRKIHCYDYLVKPFSIDEVKEVIETVINYRIKKEKKILSIKQKDFIYVIDQEEIIYIESNNRKLIVQTVREKAEYASYTLSQIASELSEDFIQCHKSYIINSKDLQEINKKECLISLKYAEEQIPYGRKYKENIRGELV